MEKEAYKRADKDRQLHQEWMKNPSKKNLGALFNQVNPIIQKETNRWGGGSVADPILQINAKKIALQAFKTYDPKQSALSTHLTNQLKGLSRDPYTYQNAARMPEHRQVKFKTFTDATERLSESFGREPTTAELARELSWSQRETGRFRKELRMEYSTSQPVPPGFESADTGAGVLSYVYHDLTPKDKLVFEHTTGYGGAPVLAAKQLTKATGLTQGQISHSKRRIRNAVKNASGF